MKASIPQISGREPQLQHPDHADPETGDQPHGGPSIAAGEIADSREDGTAQDGEGEQDEQIAPEFFSGLFELDECLVGPLLHLLVRRRVDVVRIDRGIPSPIDRTSSPNSFDPTTTIGVAGSSTPNSARAGCRTPSTTTSPAGLSRPTVAPREPE